MVMYSGHDTTVSALLNTLKLFDFHNPPFLACVMLELRLHQGTPYVTVVYKNDTDPTTLVIPGCGVTCPLKKMFDLYDDVLPTDWETECQMPPLVEALIRKVGYDMSATIIVLAIVGVILLLSMVFFGVYRIHKRSRRNLYTEIYDQWGHRY